MIPTLQANIENRSTQENHLKTPGKNLENYSLFRQKYSTKYSLFR
jgi:hypothetical protein